MNKLSNDIGQVIQSFGDCKSQLSFNQINKAHRQINITRLSGKKLTNKDLERYRHVKYLDVGNNEFITYGGIENLNMPLSISLGGSINYVIMTKIDENTVSEDYFGYMNRVVNIKSYRNDSLSHNISRAIRICEKIYRTEGAILLVN